MSSGIFVVSKYAADYGNGDNVHPILCQEETETAAIGGIDNAAAAGTLTSPISAVVSLSNRQKGLKPRTVTLRFPNTSQPTNYKAGGITKIPALNGEFYEACIKGAEVTYLGVTCTVVGRSAERVS